MAMLVSEVFPWVADRVAEGVAVIAGVEAGEGDEASGHACDVRSAAGCVKRASVRAALRVVLKFTMLLS